MKETGADTRTALLQALGLHVVLFAMMFAGLQWTRSNAAEPAAGDPIEADLIDPSALSAAMRSALQRSPEALPQPLVEPEPAPPEPEPDPAPLPEPIPDALPPPVPDPEPVEQEKVQRDAISPEVAKVQREQDEKRRPPPQVDLDARRQAEMEQQRQRQLAEIKTQREQATRERMRAEMRAQQLADAKAQQAAAGSSQASPPPGNRGTDPNLDRQYAAALQEAILRQWTRPESVELGQRCRIAIRQIPGGEVVSVEIAPSCPYDALGRRSVEAAILKASPLPYAGFEAAFSRNLDLNFIAEDR